MLKLMDWENISHSSKENIATGKKVHETWRHRMVIGKGVGWFGMDVMLGWVVQVTWAEYPNKNESHVFFVRS